MRKALLFVKVVLLLATFVGTSSSHASKSGGHNLLALSAFDANISFGQQNTTEEDKSVVTDLELPLVVFKSSPLKLGDEVARKLSTAGLSIIEVSR